jgi:hypothetical protein
MCDQAAVWDVEVKGRSEHIPVCKGHKNDAAISLCRRGELVLRPVKATPAPTCAYLSDQESHA